MREILHKNGVDAVLFSAVVDESRHLHYTRGARYTVATGMGRFGRYYVNTYQVIYQAGYFKQEVVIL